MAKKKNSKKYSEPNKGDKSPAISQDSAVVVTANPQEGEPAPEETAPPTHENSGQSEGTNLAVDASDASQAIEQGEAPKIQSQPETVPNVVVESVDSSSADKDSKTHEKSPEPQSTTTQDTNGLSSASNTSSKDPEVAESSDSTPASSTHTSPKPVKKRLTLQERLAQAAKGRAKKSKTSTPPPDSGSADFSGSSTPSQTPLALSPVVSREPSRSEADEAVDKADNEKIVAEPVSNTETENSQVIDENQQLKDKIKALEAQNSVLAETVTNLRSKPTMTSKGGWDKEKSQLEAKLKAKDDTIEQLMEEGKALSVKELKLNESIKKLKSINSNLESNLKDFQDKSEDSAIKLGELEAVLKKNGLNSLNDLLDSYSEVSHNYNNLKKEMDAYKAQDLQNKLAQLQKQYDEEVSAKNKALKDLSELNISSEMLKRQQRLEVESKNSVISDLKREIASLKSANLDEVARLENKVESLRSQIEYSGTSESIRPENSSDSKTVDYNEYNKLSSNHQSLQQQYLSSQENWKTIETNLLSKIDTLTSSVDMMKKSKTKISGDMKKLKEELDIKTESLESLTAKYESLNSEHEELISQYKLRESDLSELQEKLDKFQQIYSAERTNLNTKITSLTETINSLKAEKVNRSDSSTSIKTFNDSGLHINIGSASKLAQPSGNPETPMSYQSSHWNEIKLGESSLTPSVQPSQLFMNHNNSSTSFGGDDTTDDSFDYPRERENSFGQGSSFQHHSVSHNSLGGLGASASTVGTIPTGGGNSKIQLINKMSSNIRRLEIELNTLKEENLQLVREKESTQQELLGKIQTIQELEAIKDQVESLEAQLEAKSLGEQTMLELIGEKSEQVEELKADIVDLKDLCRSQVQQMIAMQEHK